MEEGSLKIVPASLPSISQPCHWDWAIWMGPCGGAVTRGYDGDITWVCILTASEGLEESHRDVLDINSFSLNVCCAPKCMLLTNVCDKWAYICVGERSHKRTRWSLSMHLYNWATTVSMQRHYAKIWPGGSLGAMLWGLVALVCARLRLSPHTHLCFIRGDSVRQGDCGRIHPPPEIMYKSVPQCSIYIPCPLPLSYFLPCLRFLLNQLKSCLACHSGYCLYLFVLSSPSLSLFPLRYDRVVHSKYYG